MTKNEYLKELLLDKRAFKQLSEAAILFWHAKVPLIDAHIYMKNLEERLIENE